MKRSVPFMLVLLSLLLAGALLVAGACTGQARVSPAPTPTAAASPKASPSPSPAPKTTAAPTAASPKPTAAPTKPSTDVISIKASSFEPPTSDRSKIFQEFGKALKDKSKGQLAFEYLGGPEVIGATEVPSAVRKGTVQMATAGGSHVGSLVKEVMLLALSRIPSDEERKVGAMKFLDDLTAKVGIKLVGRLDPKPGENFFFYMMKKVTTPDGFKGIRMAANGTYVQAVSKALGMSFTVIKMEDAFTGLDRGTFDAYSTAMSLGVGLSIHEVAKFLLDHPVYRSNTTIIMNRDTWNKLSPDMQKVVESTYLEFEPRLIEASAREAETGKAKFREKGVEFVKFSQADLEKFMDIAYSSEAEAQLKSNPETATPYLKMVKAIK